MTRPAALEHMPWRITGLALLGVLVVLYQTDQSDVVHRLAIPIAMAVATWLLVQNLLSVALGAGLLALIHSNLGGDWIAGLAYPALAAVCGVIVAAILGGRFRRRIHATHEARWRARRERRNGDGGSRENS